MLGWQSAVRTWQKLVWQNLVDPLLFSIVCSWENGAFYHEAATKKRAPKNDRMVPFSVEQIVPQQSYAAKSCSKNVFRPRKLITLGKSINEASINFTFKFRAWFWFCSCLVLISIFEQLSPNFRKEITKRDAKNAHIRQSQYFSNDVICSTSN